MQIRPDQLEQQLARGLKPLYTVHGDEPLLAQEAADAIRAAAYPLTPVLCAYRLLNKRIFSYTSK